MTTPLQHPEVGQTVWLRVYRNSTYHAEPRLCVGYCYWNFGAGPSLHFLCYDEETGKTDERHVVYATEDDALGKPAQT